MIREESAVSPELRSVIRALYRSGLNRMTWFLTRLRAILDNRGGPMSMAKSLPIGPKKPIGKGFPIVLDFLPCPIAENGQALMISEAR